jgi:hypothetical protein
MRAEDRDSAVRHFVEFLDETRAFVPQIVDDVPIVNDFVAHVDGRAMPFEGPIDDFDRTDHARTKAAGLSKDDTHIRANSDWRGFRVSRRGGVRPFESISSGEQNARGLTKTIGNKGTILSNFAAKLTAYSNAFAFWMLVTRL